MFEVIVIQPGRVPQIKLISESSVTLHRSLAQMKQPSAILKSKLNPENKAG